MLVVQRPGPVKYAEILNLELQLRECPMPEGLSVPILTTPDIGLPEDATTKHLQRFTALIMRESGIFSHARSVYTPFLYVFHDT